MANWIVTNAASGFGLALSAELLERGDMVAAVVATQAQRQALEQRFSARPLCYVLSLDEADAVRDAVDEIQALMGGIDAVVNGEADMPVCANLALDDLRSHVAHHVFGAVNLIQAVLPSMRRQRRGHFFTLLPMAADGLQQGSVAALSGITEALDVEMAGQGIRATAVTLEPGHSSDAWRRAAQAILLAASARHPPRRLLLGKRALHQMRRHIGQLQDELSDWELVSLNTGQAGWRDVGAMSST